MEASGAGESGADNHKGRERKNHVFGFEGAKRDSGGKRVVPDLG